jgi:N-acetylglucosaminyl-diphospho-decaprenol L-rhamnosyltransferase
VTADVVIPTWRARDILERCLRALEADPSPKRVIVVDNGSRDGTVELVRDAFPAVTLVELPENAGFGRAVNAGVRVGNGEAIVLINNDMCVEPGYVAAITMPLATSGMGMVAGLTTIPDAGGVDGFGIELDRGLAAYNRGRQAPPGRLAMPSGGAAAYRREAWEEVGGFDEALFAYGEDVDLGLQLRARGWRAAEAVQARAAHLGGATAQVDSQFQRELAGFARGFLLRRYGVLRSRGALHALAIDALVVAWGLLRHRTAVPLRARVRGWRAAGADGPRPLPPDVVDPEIGIAEAVRRLRSR